METKNKYIPALKFRWLTPLYDPVLRWVMQEEGFKQLLIRQAQIMPGQRVLDLGCGTATLTIMLKQAQPEADVAGLDGDPEVLAIGREKIAKAGVEVRLDEGMAYSLPYPDQSFDRVVSSLVFHHLSDENKQRTLKEIFRVLTPAGEVHIADFGRPRSLWTHLVTPLMGRLEETGELVNGLLPSRMRQAGFEQAEEIAHFNTVFGTISLYQGRKK
jgi:ubiquinone/menaquinone biosynthesis C-methylase UbiE